MHTVSYSYANGSAFSIVITDTATAAQQTAAIQTALTAVAANAGGSVSLSAGTWSLQGTGKAADGCLKIGSNTTFEGAGMGQTVLKLADGSPAVTGILRTDSGKTLPDGTYTTVHDIAVKGLSIDGNKATATGDVDGFYCGPKPGTAQADTNITLDGVEIMNCSRYGFDPHEQTIGLTIRNSSAHHNGVDGYTIDFCSNVLIENSVAYANGRHGFNIVTGSTYVTMINNDAYANGGSGISLQTGDNEIRAWTDFITVTGGTVENNGRAGIEAKMVSHLDVSGVIVSGNAMDGILISGTAAATVHDNMYYSNGGTGSVRVSGYLQTFGDTDTLNDRWVASTNIVVDGVVAGPTPAPAGVAVWTYVIGTGDDTITGSAGRDVIAAGSGNDTVNGGGSNDILYGNDGSDALDGSVGDDKLYGGAGDDRLIYSGGIDTLDGGAGIDMVDLSKLSAGIVADLGSSSFELQIKGAAIADLINIENIRATTYADRITGNAFANSLDANGGNDTLFGGDGNDSLFGGAGNDQLTGGSGADWLSGGTGSDFFYFFAGAGADVVADFTRKQDKIVITGVTGVVSFADLVITADGADSIVHYGADQISLIGLTPGLLSATNFIFI